AAAARPPLRDGLRAGERNVDVRRVAAFRLLDKPDDRERGAADLHRAADLEIVGRRVALVDQGDVLAGVSCRESPAGTDGGVAERAELRLADVRAVHG